MRWAIFTLVIVVLLAWVSINLPLSSILPGGPSTGRQLQELDARLTGNPDWDGAHSAVTTLKNSWERLEPWLEFFHEKGTVAEFRSGLARLTGAVESRDLAAARQELEQLQMLWRDLNRL